MSHIKQLFKLLHGMYGNQLLDKYRTGQLDNAGVDLGVVSAQAIWLQGLREFDFQVIRAAVAQCDSKHKIFTPTLPEFRDLCKTCVPWKIRNPEIQQIEISEELRSQNKKRFRATLDNLRPHSFRSQNLPVFKVGIGLPALLMIVAKAVGDAGGDEAKTLQELESKFPNLYN